MFKSVHTYDSIIDMQLMQRWYAHIKYYILKDSPHPHLSVSFGLLNTNCEENFSFLKSISVPSKYITAAESMNTFEHKNLINSEVTTQKRKSLFRSLIKPVEAGAHGTLNYVVKKGLGKNKIAKK